MQDFLTRFKQIDAVWAADDDMAVGVLKAIEQAKRKDIKIVFGGAGMKSMVKTLMDGTNPLIQANVSYSPKFIYDAIQDDRDGAPEGPRSWPPTTSSRRC
jgi:ribose transport system substrate-binding protein